MFEMWTNWSFKHQGFLAILDTDTEGQPTEISFSLLSRGNGEFRKLQEAVQLGHFEGMPVARYSFVTSESSVSREFYEKCGFEVVTSFMRHGYKALLAFNGGKEEIGDVVNDFTDLMHLDNFRVEHEPEGPTL